MPKVKDYTAQEIIKLVAEKRESKPFADLFDQMETDFDLYSLEPYKAEEGHQAYTSPAPLNDFLKVFHGINKASLTWQIAIPEDAPEKERKAAGRGEALLTGVLDRANRALRNAGEPSLRETLAWFACVRGIAGLRCLIYQNGKKETEIDIRALDPLHMVWEQGAQGLLWAAFTYRISRAESEERFGLEPGQGEAEAEFIDFFTKEINAQVLSSGGAGEFVKEPLEHGLTHVPIFIGFNGGMPTVRTKDNTLTLKQRACSVYAASRQFYEARNKHVSYVMDVAEKSVAGTLVHESEDGRPLREGDPFGAFTVLNMKVADKEKVFPLVPPQAPPETSAILSILDREKQESTVPFPIGYGLDPQAHSGAALALMNDNTRSIYGPFTSLIEDAVQWLCEEILTQFKSKGQKLSLKGFDTSGKFFVVEANPEDVQDDWYVNVKCEPKLPRDEAAALQMALAATSPGPDGVPLLSRFTAREKILTLQDPEAEKKRIEEEAIERMIMGMPNIQVRRVANELRKKGDLEGARELLASLPSPMGGSPGPGPQAASPAGSAQAQGPAPQGMPMPTLEELAQLQAIVARMQAAGQPVPPELLAVLQMAQGGRLPQML